MISDRCKKRLQGRSKRKRWDNRVGWLRQKQEELNAGMMVSQLDEVEEEVRKGFYHQGSNQMKPRLSSGSCVPEGCHLTLPPGKLLRALLYREISRETTPGSHQEHPKHEPTSESLFWRWPPPGDSKSIGSLNREGGMKEMRQWNGHRG